jgi:polyisoprenyl-phosphate glycosyltransferase
MSLVTHIQALKGPVLVMGASGFIGANLFKTLLLHRKDVFAGVRDDKGWRLADIDDEHVIAVDLNDFVATKHLVDTLVPMTVFDCVSYGAYAFEADQPLIYNTNFQSLVNFVSLLATHKIAAYIHAGSSSEYGSNCTAPLETDPCYPNSHYAVSKVAAASYLQYQGKEAGFPVINLRLYSVYGPLEDSSRLIPNLIRHALAGKLPPFVDPATSRDFLYVDDVSLAFILAATKMEPELYGENFNVGSGIKTTIADLAEITQSVFDVTDEPQYGKMEGRAWDLAEWYSNPEKIKKHLGWKPEYDLDAGLKASADWVSKLSDIDFNAVTKKNITHKKRSISAIIACYKDAQAIPIMYRRLTDTFQKIGVDYEIIFVNDGSPDDSAEVIRDLSTHDNRVIGISHSRNFGSQMAFRSGMELSTKHAVVLLDGDLQDPPELIERFYEQWELGYNVVYGRRVKRDMPWYMGIMYKLFYRVFSTLSFVNIPHDAGDFSLIDRRVVNWMLKCPERDLFMRGIRAYVGFKQVGVDYVRPERMFGRSTNNFMKNIGWAKKGIFSFSNAPLTMLTTLGVILLGISFLLIIIAVILKLFFPDIAPRGATTLLIATLTFGSLNLFAVGLVGEYVAKIIAEVKGRPHLIRSALIRNGKSTDLLADGSKD